MGSEQGRPEIPAGMDDNMGEVRFISAEGESSIRSKLVQGGPIAVRLRLAPDSDVEGHSLGDSVVLAIARFDDSDVEGHALSIHFPDAAKARRFRNEVIAAGALTATIALGVGISQLPPSAQLGQSQAGSGTQSHAMWIDTSGAAPTLRYVPHQVAPDEGGAGAQAVQEGAAAPAFRAVPHQVAPDEGGAGASVVQGGAGAPAVQIPHQVPPDER